jgi:hypothetical protein
MRDTDPRVHDLFKHLREALEILEQLMLHPRTPNVPKPTERSKFNQHVVVRSMVTLAVGSCVL